MKLDSIKNGIKKALLRAVWAFSGTNRRRVVFSSFTGKAYSDNPKAVSEALHEIAPELEIVWLCSGANLEGLPAYARQVNRTRFLPHYRALASAKVVVENFGFSDIPKKKSQRYIQTWHGDRAFKKILYDSPFARNLFLPESKPGFCDLAVAGSDYGEMQYRSAFHYRGEILKIGTPRNDCLLRADEHLFQRKLKQIGLSPEYRYLLYAPTLRRANQHSTSRQSIQQLDIPAALRAFSARFGGSWRCLIRAHPAVCGLTGYEGNADVMDLSAYPDMADLLLISSALITDYSSCAGDFALLKRPILLYQPDIEEYLKKDRPLYFAMEDAPYFTARSQAELEQLIGAMTPEAAASNCAAILRFYGTNETGNAAGTLASYIADFCRQQ